MHKIGGISLIALALLMSLATSGAAQTNSKSMQSGLSEYVDGHGNISLPQDYAKTFVYLGTFAISDEGGVQQLHVVYTRPSDAEAYKRDGKFPDGAILVKEVYKTQSGDFTTGHGSYSKDLVQWFVMVKDSKNRFAENPNWGLGWGWALIKPEDRSKNISTNYATDCKSCHLPAQKNDWNYIEGYPVLRRASAK